MKYLSFVISKSAQPFFKENQIFLSDFWKLGPKGAQIGKFIGICMGNGQKIIQKAYNFSLKFSQRSHRSTDRKFEADF